MKRWIKLITLFILLIVIDIVSKNYVYHNIPKISWVNPFFPYGGIGVFKDFFGISFSINLVENTGAAWGIFSKYPSFIFFIRILVIIGLVIYLVAFNKGKQRQVPLVLIIAGALGNILDYIFYRKVIDMFHFNFWGYSYPVFNFADALITIGIIWLFFTFLFDKIGKRHEN